MKLGEKIRSARLSVGMTQAELAGDFITRNMLSQIENGLAMPSLQTALYIADRLGVDAGILFSENEDTNVYFLTRKLPEIKKAFKDCDYDKCIEIGTKDCECDESCLIVAECYIKKAYQMYEKGKLRQALKFGESAKKSIQKCIYSSDGIDFKYDMLCVLISIVCPSLCPKVKDEERDIFLEKYIEKSGNKTVYGIESTANTYLENGEYEKAIEIYRGFLKDKNIVVPFLYTVYCKLEICYREIQDFENAYKCMQTAKKMHDEMQS